MVNDMTDSKPNNAPKFEDAIDQVEAIIAEIESGEIDLEQCLERYEKGVKLIKHCQAILKSAEEKIAALKVDEAGNLVVEGETVESAEMEEDETF